MAKVKGKFITLAGFLMALYPKVREQADAQLFSETGKHWDQLDPEVWYDTKLFNLFMQKYAEGSSTRKKAIVSLGRNVYPTIKKTVGLPPDLDTPLKLLVFEAEGFLANHQGADVKPRKMLKSTEGDMIVQAPAPGYDCMLYEGVFLGILEMTGIADGKVVQTKCIERGDPTCEFHITWKK